MELLIGILGFIICAYAVIANAAIQTLGTFMASNHRLKWWWLWLFAVSILALTLIYGWYANSRDASYGRY